MTIIDPSKAPKDIQNWLIRSRETIDKELSLVLALPATSSDDPLSKIVDAMRYAVLGGGKRLRPALSLAACGACGVSSEKAIPAALAVELLHAYTLVHDDLPAMDDDDVRRGRPTVHVQYDEATAILVGDALLTLAFKVLTTLEHGVADAVALLAQRSGHQELLGGQMLDLHWQKDMYTPTFQEVEQLHAGKTGALFSAACQLGGIAANAPTSLVESLSSYGMNVGIAFQHADDIDDGDFSDLKERASCRRIELSSFAKQDAEVFGESGILLRNFATWIGRAE